MAFRLTQSEARALGVKIPAAPRRKFHNRPGYLDEIHFDSQLELRRYAYLIHVEMAKKIDQLQVHPKFPLYGSVGVEDGARPVCVGFYEADFAYRVVEGQRNMVEDCKGMMLPLYLLKRRLFVANYPELQLMEVRQCRGRWISQPVTALSVERN